MPLLAATSSLYRETFCGPGPQGGAGLFVQFILRSCTWSAPSPSPTKGSSGDAQMSVAIMSLPLNLYLSLLSSHTQHLLPHVSLLCMHV